MNDFKKKKNVLFVNQYAISTFEAKLIMRRLTKLINRECL